MTERLSPRIQTVVISNNREYYSPLDPLVPKVHKDEFVQSDFDESDMNLMWEGDNKVVVLPKPVDPTFIADIFTMFNYKNVQTMMPRESDNGLSLDCVSDPSVFDSLVKTLRGSPDINVISWGQTPQFLQLKTKLEEAGANFYTPEIPETKNLWVPDYLDTKMGSRELLLRAQKGDSRVDLPEGFACADIGTALTLAKYFIDSGRGVVFKANLGGAGIGVHVFPPKDNPGQQDSIVEMGTTLESNELFSTGPIIVEEYIPPDFQQHATFPSVDSVIGKNGKVEIKAVDAMVISHDEEEVEFYGCLLGNGLFSDSQEEKLRGISMSVGDELSRLGYRGWFDVDYIMSRDGKMYASEVNLRRTSMSYMLDLAKTLFGDDFEKKMAMRSNDKFIKPQLKGLTHPQLKDLLSGLLYPINGISKGVVITQSLRSMFDRGKFGYVSIGKDQEETRQIEMELLNQVSKI